MKTWSIRIGLAAAALVVAFLAGRYSAPKKVTEEATKSSAITTSSAATEVKNLAVDEVVDRKTTVRRAPARPAAPAPASGVCPECPAVDETVIEERAMRRALDLGITTIIASGTIQTEERTTKVTESARPSWSVALLAGWKPDAPGPTPSVYQLQGDHRLIGTLWAGVWVQGEDVPDRPDKRGGWKLTAYGALARLEF
jgi:hypothetical protein